jgi:glycosyltransferase involved in cell wall biosynthesis
MKMRIAYDHQIFSWQKYGGISRYFYDIAARMPGVCGCDVKIIAPLYVNRYLMDNPLPYVIGMPWIWIPKSGRAMQILSAPLAQYFLHREKPDVVHETYYYEKKLSPRKSRTVLTVFDMVHEKYPHCYRSSDKTRNMKKEAVKRADHIICISENTRRDLIEFLGTEKERTSVVHFGNSLSAEINTDHPKLISRPYIAYVGLRRGYKNFSNLLGAYASSDFLKNNYMLVCFGGGCFDKRELNEIADLRIPPGSIIQMEGGDHVLAEIYRHADIFVYPSLYEGFGIPPLEAMSLGCPVACSFTSSLPEVCGNAAEYFDPRDIESIRSSIENVLESSIRRDELVRAGLSQSLNFSWKKCTKQTAAVYKDLL